MPIDTDFNMGIRLYRSGEFTAAYRKFMNVAIRGNVQAQTLLGIMYNKGEGIEHNEAEAARWYRKAADKGDARAQYNLAVLYLTGAELQQDPGEAAKWHRQSS